MWAGWLQSAEERRRPVLTTSLEESAIQYRPLHRVTVRGRGRTSIQPFSCLRFGVSRPNNTTGKLSHGCNTTEDFKAFWRSHFGCFTHHCSAYLCDSWSLGQPQRPRKVCWSERRTAESYLSPTFSSVQPISGRCSATFSSVRNICMGKLLRVQQLKSATPVYAVGWG